MGGLVHLGVAGKDNGGTDGEVPVIVVIPSIGGGEFILFVDCEIDGAIFVIDGRALIAEAETECAVFAETGKGDAAVPGVFPVAVEDCR